MFRDCRGLPLSTVSQASAAAFDHAIAGYLGYRADLPVRMAALSAIDPDFGLVALPVTEATLAHGQGRHAHALALMRQVLGEMVRMGGSYAQQDVLAQLFLDSALKAGSEADARMLLRRVGGRHPLPPARRRYAIAAQPPT